MLSGIGFSLPSGLVADRAEPREIPATPIGPASATDAAKAVVATAQAVHFFPQHPGDREGGREGQGRNPQRQSAPDTNMATYAIAPGPSRSSGVANFIFLPLLSAADPRAGITFSVLV